MIFKHKKSLGQNFLNSKNVVFDMCNTSNLKSEDIVVEAGPGKGVMTEELLKKVTKVIAVEKDVRLIDILKEKFKKEIEDNKLEILNNDILLFNPRAHGLKTGEYKIVANIPYYITGSFFEYFLSHDIYPGEMTVLVQKEVAERITRDRKESILSMSVKVYGSPKYIKTIKRGNFTPTPAVDSAIIKIEDISKKKFVESRVSELQFFDLLKRGFSHKRKKLSKNINIEENILENCGLSKKVRAEELSIENWFCILNSRRSSSR